MLLQCFPELFLLMNRLLNSTLTGKFLDVTMKEATKNTLVAVEIACWERL